MDFMNHFTAVLSYVDARIHHASNGGKPITRTMLCGSRAVLRERCRPDADWDVLAHVIHGEHIPAVRGLLPASRRTATATTSRATPSSSRVGAPLPPSAPSTSS